MDYRGKQARGHGQSALPEPGMVTSEFALVLPVFIFIGFLLAALLVAGSQHVRVGNEAKEIAREVSIGGEAALADGARSSGATVNVAIEGDIVSVSVRRSGSGVLEWLNIDFVGTHRMVVEPGVAHG